MRLPEEFCARMQALLGDEYEAFLRSYETETNKGIRINTLKCSEAVAAELGAADRIPWCESGYYTRDGISGNHPYHAAGMIYFQEPSAMCAAQALPLGGRVLDLCAAPGGKTTHIAQRMRGRGLLVANEIIQKRAAILAENVERMGLTNTVVTNESPARLAAKFPGFFDGIIVDAPCSGEGMFRKEPQAADEWSARHTLSCAARQRSISDAAYKMLKPGGYILYSTCTFSVDENEHVIEYMAEEYGMEICEMPELSMLSPGVGDFPGIEKCRRVLPHRHRGEGHFAALLKKPAQQGASVSTKKTAPRRAIPADAMKLWREFEKTALYTECSGEFVLFGDNLYLMPEELDIDKLKVIRCGLHLGTVKKNRFEPSHALSHAFSAKDYKSFIELEPGSAELKGFMRGEVIPASHSGWCVVGVRDCGIGWGKASGGMLKNHYPKRLRTLK